MSSWENLNTALSEGAAVITANARQSGWVTAKFNMAMLDQGLQVWPSPQALPWSAWLIKLWNDYLDQPAINRPPYRLLAVGQEALLWEQIIAHSQIGNSLLDTTATAQQVAAAWSILHEWHLPFQEESYNYNEDSLAFFAWAEAFATQCEQKKWLSRARLPQLLHDLIAAGNINAPSSIILYGFEELTPQQQNLIDILEQNGCKISSFDLPQRSQLPAAKIKFVGSTSEIETIARWAREILTQRPEAKIAVAVPDLAKQRPLIEKIFSAIFIPDAADSPTDNGLQNYLNFSLGFALASYPIIHDALNALALMFENTAIDMLGSILRSPFIGSENEYYARSQLEIRLRERGEPNLPLRKAMLGYETTLKTLFSRACPDFSERLINFYQHLAAQPVQQAPSQWATVFSRLLGILGWPGKRVLNSSEYQTVAAWRDILHGLASLDPFTASGLDARAALLRLRQLSNETIFQPKSLDTPVQILGLLEASGLEFDHLWITGLNDAELPRPARPTPYLPLPLQHQHRVPYSNAKRELEYAEQLLNRLLWSSKQVIVSYASMEEDRELQPSPLIDRLPELAINELSLSSVQTHQKRLFQARQYEQVANDQPIPVQTHEKLRGGTNIIKFQGACPFRAFVQLRLGGSPWPSMHIGLTPLERGILLHESLRQLWLRLESQATLMSLSVPALHQVVNAAVTTAIEIAAKTRPEIFTSLFYTIEQERLETLLLGWLDIEKQRAPFTVIETEAQCQVTIGNIEITAKIDRIDQLPDGRLIIIDYKTNSPSPGEWFGDRPDEPQLPLYAISRNQPVAAILFAQVKSGNMLFRGLSDEAAIAPKVTTFDKSKYSFGSDWDDLFTTWRRVLNSLATEFEKGETSIMPKDFPGTCNYCHLHAVCRIHERTDPLLIDEIDNVDEAS